MTMSNVAIAMQRVGARRADADAPSPSKPQRPTDQRNGRSFVAVVGLLLPFLVGIAVGFVLHYHVAAGLTNLNDALEAPTRSKRNAKMMAKNVRDQNAVVTQVLTDATLLRVMTFNLGKNTTTQGSTTWPARRLHAADIINRYVPVVFGTQEGMDDQLADFKSLLARPYQRFGNPRATGDEHVQIFYDTSVLVRLDGGTFWLSETPKIPGTKSWDSISMRIATWCRFRLIATNQVFYHVNTHFDSHGLIARYEGVKVLWTEMKKVLTRGGLPTTTPVILTGDFNAYRPSNVFRYLTKDPNGPMFQDSWLAAEHQIGNISSTYHEFLGPMYENEPHGEWEDPDMDSLNRIGTNHIDFVLTRPSLPTMITEVITESWDGRYPSDHYPVMTTLLFPSGVELPPPMS